MNMLIGVVCDVITNVAAAEADARVSVTVTAKIREIAVRVDQDGNEFISFDEFVNLLKDEETIALLQEVDIDIYALCDNGVHMFHEGSISLDQFVEEVIKFRTSNVCTVKDLIEVRRSIGFVLKQMEERIMSQRQISL